MADVFRTPDERFEGLPGWDHTPSYGEVGGLRMHYLDAGEGDPVVMFHGEPDWGYLYRKLVDPLVASGRRVIAPDFVGFGRSDKPAEIGWYTYERHCEHVGGLLEQLSLERATVVVQDWGGPIGLRWAVENPERVAALVIMNTGLFSGRVTEGFMNWRRFAEQAGLDLPVGMIMQGASATELPDDVVAAYDAPFPTRESKAGAAAFPLLVPLTEDEPGAREMGAVRDALSRWDKPALIAFGDQDPIFPWPRAAQAFADLIPGAGEPLRIEGASHFLQEDAGERLGTEIAAFLDANES